MCKKYTLCDCVLYLSFFPQIISGPIALPRELIPQFHFTRNHWKEDAPRCFAAGLSIFILGLGKKIFFADTFGVAANWGYAQDPQTLTSLTALIVTLSYTLQIYFDFSGYSDMAKGIGLMLCLDTPDDFNSPYQALTISDFWKRWHITLTTFLTRYLYIPLGGNRRGTTRAYINVFLVFLVSGLWHGDNWTFVVWGMLHGAAQVITKIFSKQIARFHPAFNWFCTFFFVNAAWVFLRADTLTGAVLGMSAALLAALLILAACIVFLFDPFCHYHLP